MLKQKEILKIKNYLKDLVIFYDKNKNCLSLFDFKVYKFFNQIWKNEKIIKHFNITDNDIYNYLEIEYQIFIDDYKYNELLDFKQFNSTSKNYFVYSNYIKVDYNNSDVEIGYNYNNLTIVLSELYQNDYTINLFENLKKLYVDLENNKFFKINKKIIALIHDEEIIDNFLSYEIIMKELKELKSIFLEFYKSYKFIENSKNNITFNNFLSDYFYTDISEYVEKTELLYITCDMLESLYNNTEYRIIKCSDYVKIYFSFARQPKIFKIVSVQELINKIKEV